MTGSNETLGKPDFDSNEGVLPAVAVSQKSIGRNPRSTVGTITEMYDWLRILFASIGVRHCPNCGEAIIPMNIDEIEALLSGCPNVAIMTLAGETVSKSSMRQAIEEALRQGPGAFWASVDGNEPMLLQTTQMCYHCNKIMFAMTPAIFSFNNPERTCIARYAAVTVPGSK